MNGLGATSAVIGWIVLTTGVKEVLTGWASGPDVAPVAVVAASVEDVGAGVELRMRYHASAPPAASNKIVTVDLFIKMPACVGCD